MARTKLTTDRNNAPATAYSTAPFQPGAGRLVLAFVLSTAPPGIGGQTAASPTASSTNGVTWESLGAAHPGTTARVMLAGFRAMTQANVASAPLRFTFPGLQGACAWSVFEYDGVDTGGTNGSAAVLSPTAQSLSGASHDSGRSPAGRVTVGAIALAGNIGSATPGTGSSEVDKQSVAGFAGGSGLLHTQDRPASGTAESLRWTWTPQAQAAALVLELKGVPVSGSDEQEELLRRFEPILFMHPEESFFPSDAKRYLEHCALWRAQAPFDTKDSWGGTGSPYPRVPMIARDRISARPGEPGTPLDTPVNLLDTPTEERFLELGGWKDKAQTTQQSVTATSTHPYADRGEIANRYSTVPELEASRFWYHGEVVPQGRLRTLLNAAPESDVLGAHFGALKNPTLLCYFLFYPAHEQPLSPDSYCRNVEAKEVGACGGSWGCVAVLLEQDDKDGPYTPLYIGLTGEHLLQPSDLTVGRPYAVDDARRINMNVERWRPAGATPLLPDVVADHPKVSVARGSHSMSMSAGKQWGMVYTEDISPQGCGRFDTPSMIPPRPDEPTVWEDLAVILAKMSAGGVLNPLGWAAGFVAGMAERFEGGLSVVGGPGGAAFDQPDYPAAGSGRTIKPTDVGSLPEFGSQVEDWRSRQGLDVQGRRYDFIVDRTAQKWWPSEPGSPTPGGFRGRWGPRVETDPLGRRAGMRFPDFPRMFFLALADGKAKSQL
ncbi:hypothetical protein ABT237_42230 [Streptomyces sp. NPDC001581]|uniref:hypothetical protein n=1 Tax=Streptomyces sp. NPDC001581 TaxID=3154386 RepID=UPI00332FEA53